MSDTSTPPPSTRIRLVTGVALVGVLAVTLLIGRVAILGMWGVLAAIMAYEWVRMCKIRQYRSIAMLATVCATVATAGIQGRPLLALGLLLLFTSIGTLLSWFAWHRKFLWFGVGMLYIGLPTLSLVWILQNLEHPRRFLAWLIFVIAASDTGAYFGGRTLGGPLLVPEVSPKKTWSGLCSGLVLATIGGVLAFRLFMGHWGPTRHIWLASVLLALIGVLGDLIASIFKRFHRVKDTGHILPGHGGVLDRLDSLLFAIPLAAWMLNVAPDVLKF